MVLRIAMPSNIVERLKRKAENLGLTLDEYLAELALRDLDPSDRAVEYVEAAKDLLEEARRELERGNVRQAAEKLWGATALAIKAYAAWREGKRLASHRDLWEFEKVMVRELGSWVSDAWAQANAMHVCFYEGWCSREHVEEALKRVERLVSEVLEKVTGSRS